MDVEDVVFKNWIEILALIILIFGFFMALTMPNPIYIYIVIFIGGLFAGRYYFSKIGKKALFPFFLIIIGFLLGYTIGAVSADRWIVIILFFLGWLISHKVHKEGIIKI